MRHALRQNLGFLSFITLSLLRLMGRALLQALTLWRHRLVGTAGGQHGADAASAAPIRVTVAEQPRRSAADGRGLRYSPDWVKPPR